MRTYEQIKAQLEAEREKQQIACPFCAKEQTGEELYAHVTYHGEDGPKSAWCHSCGGEFTVKEHVVRTFDVTPVKRGENE